MRKSILTSVKPRECANIMNLIQSVLVTKNKREVTAIQNLIDKNGYAELYVYCTKDGYLHLENKEKNEWSYSRNQKYTYIRSGKVVFKFRCYTMEEITIGEDRRGSLFGSCHYGYHTESLRPNDLMEQSCLDVKDIINYLGRKTGYAIHISDLEIFDKPKELGEFDIYCNKHELCKCDYCERLKQAFIGFGFAGEYCDSRLTKAPQNFCYVEVE